MAWADVPGLAVIKLPLFYRHKKHRKNGNKVRIAELISTWIISTLSFQ